MKLERAVKNGGLLEFYFDKDRKASFHLGTHEHIGVSGNPIKSIGGYFSGKTLLDLIEVIECDDEDFMLFLHLIELKGRRRVQSWVQNNYITTISLSGFFNNYKDFGHLEQLVSAKLYSLDMYEAFPQGNSYYNGRIDQIKISDIDKQEQDVLRKTYATIFYDSDLDDVIETYKKEDIKDIEGLNKFLTEKGYEVNTRIKARLIRGAVLFNNKREDIVERRAPYYINGIKKLKMKRTFPISDELKQDYEDFFTKETFNKNLERIKSMREKYNLDLQSLFNFYQRLYNVERHKVVRLSYDKKSTSYNEPSDLLQDYLTDHDEYLYALSQIEDNTRDKYPKNYVVERNRCFSDYHIELDKINKKRQAKREKKYLETVVNDDINFKTNGYVFMTPPSLESIRQEGKDQRNCVGSYINGMMKGQRYVVFMRKEKELDESYVTINLSADRQRVIESRTNRNRGIASDLAKESIKEFEEYLQTLEPYEEEE